MSPTEAGGKKYLNETEEHDFDLNDELDSDIKFDENDVKLEENDIKHEENEEEAQEAGNVAKDYLSVLDDQT